MILFYFLSTFPYTNIYKNYMPLHQINNMHSSMGSVCTSMVLATAFGLGFLLYLNFIIPGGSIAAAGVVSIIIPLFEAYLSHLVGALEQAIAELPLDIINNLSAQDALIYLQYLAPLIEVSESIFSMFPHLINYLERFDFENFEALNEL